jgi:hypothetical protein
MPKGEQKEVYFAPLQVHKCWAALLLLDLLAIQHEGAICLRTRAQQTATKSFAGALQGLPLGFAVAQTRIIPLIT